MAFAKMKFLVTPLGVRHDETLGGRVGRIVTKNFILIKIFCNRILPKQIYPADQKESWFGGFYSSWLNIKPYNFNPDPKSQ